MNKDDKNAYARAWYQKNKKRVLAKRKASHQLKTKEQKEARREQQREWARTPSVKSKRAALYNQWRLNNKDKRAASQRAYNRRQPEFGIKAAIASARAAGELDGLIQGLKLALIKFDRTHERGRDNSSEG